MPLGTLPSIDASLELRASEHGPIGRLPASAGLFSHTLPHETFAPTGTVLLATANLQIDLPLALSVTVRNDTDTHSAQMNHSGPSQKSQVD